MIKTLDNCIILLTTGVIFAHFCNLVNLQLFNFCCPMRRTYVCIFGLFVLLIVFAYVYRIHKQKILSQRGISPQHSDVLKYFKLSMCN